MDRRKTLQRELVYTALNGLHNHPTADEVYAEIVKSYPTVSRATVYRNLNLLAEEGKIKKVEAPDGPDRFDSITKPHYHFHCIKCNRAYDVEMDVIENLENLVRNKKGHIFMSSEVVFRGICEECQKSIKI